MKTVKQWLETIADEEIREKALGNMKEGNQTYSAGSMSQAIIAAFGWRESPEGFEYWDRIYGLALYDNL